MSAQPGERPKVQHHFGRPCYPNEIVSETLQGNKIVTVKRCECGREQTFKRNATQWEIDSNKPIPGSRPPDKPIDVEDK